MEVCEQIKTLKSFKVGKGERTLGLNIYLEPRLVLGVDLPETQVQKGLIINVRVDSLDSDPHSGHFWSCGDGSKGSMGPKLARSGMLLWRLLILHQDTLGGTSALLLLPEETPEKALSEALETTFEGALAAFSAA